MSEDIGQEKAVRLGYRFAAIPEWVLDHPDLSALAVRLYGVLSRYVGADCIPSHATLAERCRCSERTIIRTIGELTSAGAVGVEHRYKDGRQTSNRYLLAGDHPLKEGGGGHRRHPGVTPVTPPGVTPVSDDLEKKDPEKQLRAALSVVPPPGDGSAPSGRKRRPRDEIWDAIVEVCSLDPSGLTKSTCSDIGKTKRELLEVNASAAEIRARSARYKKRFPGAALTPAALRKHWPSLAGPSYNSEVETETAVLRNGTWISKSALR